MILDTSSISKQCNGKLGSNFNLKLITRLEDLDEGVRRLYYTVLIDKTSECEPFIYYKNQITSKVKLNDSQIDKISVDLDFTSNQPGYILNSSHIDIPSDERQYLLVRCNLIIEDNKSNYLSNTDLVSPIIISHEIKNQEPKCNIEIIGETDKLVNFNSITSNYGLLELKVNDNSWHCLEGTRFNVLKLNKRQYVQTRIKVDNKYYYSNVITINPSDD